jgi:hypothetical protein
MSESKFAIRKKQAPKRTWSAANSNVNKFAAPKSNVIQEKPPSELELLAHQKVTIPLMSLQEENDSLPSMYRHRIQLCMSRFDDLYLTTNPDIEVPIQTVVIVFPQLSNPFDSSPVFKYGKKHQEITDVYGSDGFDDSFIKSLEADRAERKKIGNKEPSFVWKVYAFSGIYSVRSMPADASDSLIPGMAYGATIILHQGNRHLSIVNFAKAKLPKKVMKIGKVLNVGVGDVIAHQADVLIGHPLKQLDSYHGWMVPTFQGQWPSRPPHPLLLESLGNGACLNWATNPGVFAFSGIDVALIPYAAIAFISRLLATLQPDGADAMDATKADDAILSLLLESGHLLPVAPFMALFRREDEDCVMLKTLPHLLIVTDSPDDKICSVNDVRVMYVSKEKGIRQITVQ